MGEYVRTNLEYVIEQICNPTVQSLAHILYAYQKNTQHSDWHSKRPFLKDLCCRCLGTYGSQVPSLHSL